MRIFGLGIEAMTFSPPRYRDWSALLTCARGTCVARTNAGVVPVFGDRGLLLERERVELTVRQRADIRVLYTRGRAEQRLRCVQITPVLAAIIERFVERGYLDPQIARDRRMLAVAADEYDGLVSPQTTLMMAHPPDPTIRSATSLWMDHPAPSLEETAYAIGCSVRTLQRAFSTRAGTGAATWRRRCAIIAALMMISAGATVTSAALDTGYATASAFIQACRREFGRTPLALLRRSI
jgi:AraC-like DNA-binding protein